jgi:hypothetical protein
LERQAAKVIFLCRQCGRKGDGIQFLREKGNLTYAQACAELNVTQQWNRRLPPIDTSWKHQPPTQRVIVSGPKKIETNAPPEVIAPLPEPIPFETLTRQWRNLDLLDMIPKGRRAEVTRILEADPNKKQVLVLCKLGAYDAFEAMRRLGMPEPDNPFTEETLPDE